MGKWSLTLMVALFSFGAFAKSEAETIRQIELKKDARCTYKYSSNRYCFNMTCYTWKNYQCLSNNASENDFKVRLRVRTVMDGEPSVTSVTYFEN